MSGRVRLALAAALASAVACTGESREPGTSSAGQLRVERAVLVPGAGLAPAVVYAEVVNATDAPDTLTALRVAGAAAAMLHRSETDSAGHVSMHHVASVAIAPQSTVRLAPGGLHAMVEGLSPAPVRGDSVVVTFAFARAGAREVFAAVIGYADVERATDPHSHGHK